MVKSCKFDWDFELVVAEVRLPRWAKSQKVLEATNEK